MSQRIFYLDLLKGVSIVFVVLLHVSALGLSETNVGNYAWEVYIIADSFCRFTVPVFVMISGALMLDEKKEFKLIKSVRRLMVPLFLWSFLYALVVIGYQYREVSLESLQKILRLTFVTPTHNWFLFMLIGLYMMIPLIKPLLKDNQQTINVMGG